MCPPHTPLKKFHLQRVSSQYYQTSVLIWNPRLSHRQVLANPASPVSTANDFSSHQLSGKSCNLSALGFHMENISTILDFYQDQTKAIMWQSSVRNKVFSSLFINLFCFHVEITWLTFRRNGFIDTVNIWRISSLEGVMASAPIIVEIQQESQLKTVLVLSIPKARVMWGLLSDPLNY